MLRHIPRFLSAMLRTAMTLYHLVSSILCCHLRPLSDVPAPCPVSSHQSSTFPSLSYHFPCFSSPLLSVFPSFSHLFYPFLHQFSFFLSTNTLFSSSSISPASFVHGQPILVADRPTVFGVNQQHGVCPWKQGEGEKKKGEKKKKQVHLMIRKSET